MTVTRNGATTREKLIDATESLMCEGGLSAVTTQSVARSAGVAEGTIYRHFESREDLIVTTLRERLKGEFQAPIDALCARAGSGDMTLALADFITNVMPIFTIIAPSLGMLAADPKLAASNASAMQADSKGPGHLLDGVADYFVEEQRLGRIAPDIDARAAAGMIFSICFYRSLMEHLFGKNITGICEIDMPGAIAKILARGVQSPAPELSAQALI